VINLIDRHDDDDDDLAFDVRSSPPPSSFTTRTDTRLVSARTQGPTPQYAGKPTLSVSLLPPAFASVGRCACCAPDASTSAPSTPTPARTSFGDLTPPVRSPQPKPDPLSRAKRARCLSWDDYFMSVAFLSAQRSKDPNKQVGACIVGKDKLILGVGYNGFPRGCADDALPWSKKSIDDDPLETKYAYVCHAEMNAIMNKNSASVAGGSLYVTMYPCNECAKLIIQAGIEEVVYYEGKISEAKTEDGAPDGGKGDPIYAASKRLLTLAGVRVRQHRPSVAIEVTYLDVVESST